MEILFAFLLGAAASMFWKDKLEAEHAAEIDEFNAGFDAAVRGEPIENEPYDSVYDEWRIGWVWGDHQKRKGQEDA